jgi:tRNA threonylcarbamoyl adenosine modification protein (Sua5/YciO/YrdC/YwlC family)
MSQFFRIHPDNPQQRLIKQAAEYIQNEKLIAYPTDSGYALGCKLGCKSTVARIRQIRQLSSDHNFTLICKDLTEVGVYARFSTPIFRLLKANTPGAYTFILKATKEVPKKTQHPKKRTVGIRIPSNKIVIALLEEIGETLLSSSLILPGASDPMTDAQDIQDELHNMVDLIIDGGFCGTGPTTVIEFLDEQPKIIRVGVGDVSPFQ